MALDRRSGSSAVRVEKSMMGRESEVKAVRSLMKLNLEGTALRLEELAKSLMAVSNSNG